MTFGVFFYTSLLFGFYLVKQNDVIVTQKSDNEYVEYISKYSKNLMDLKHNQLLTLGNAYEKTGNLDGAIRVFQFMLQKDPKDYLAMFKLANVYRRQKKFSEAIKYYNQSITINPQFEEGYIELGETILEFKPKNLVEVRTIYEDLSQKFGSNIIYDQKICELAAREGQHQLSQKYCQKVIKKDPNNFNANYYLGIILKDMGELEKADLHFEKMASNFKFSEEETFSLALYFEDRNNIIKALSVLEPIVKNEKADVKYLIKAAMWSCMMNKFDDCHLYFSRACINNSRASIEIRKSMAYVKMMKDQALNKKFESLYHSCFSNKIK